MKKIQTTIIFPEEKKKKEKLKVNGKHDGCIARG